MQINSSNAPIVAAIFASLSDARFSMRTVAVIVKSSAPAATAENAEPQAAFTAAEVANAALDMGLVLRHRVRDGAPLIERPTTVTPDEALALSRKAAGVLAGSEAAFEVSYAPAQPDLADPDLFEEIEGGLMN